MLFHHRKSSRINLILILTLLAGMLGLWPARPVHAATVIVTSSADSGAGSLRQAIADANPADTITFDPSLAGQVIRLAAGLTIDKNLTVDGSSLSPHVQVSGDTDANGTGDVPLLTIAAGATVEIAGLDFVDGYFSTFLGAGGIYNSGDLTVTDGVFSGNTGDQGGALHNSAVLTITGSYFTDNSAVEGGAIFNDASGDLEVTDSTFLQNDATHAPEPVGAGGAIANIGALTVTAGTFSGNTAQAGGGGIANALAGTVEIANSTFAGNSTDGNGGGVYNFEGTMTISNSTFSANAAGANGGGLANAGTLHLSNTILADSPAGDCFNDGGTISTNINNLIETQAASPNDCGTPLLSSDPNLDALADNGGATQTMALLSGSPAIDAGDDTTCEPADQRGVARPLGPHCDLGAFEALDTTAPAVSSIVRAGPDPTDATSVDFTVTFSEPVSGVDAGDFTLSVGGLTGPLISAVSGADDVYTVSVNTGSGDGTVRLDLVDDDTIVDGSSNPLGGAGEGNGDFTGGESYTVYHAHLAPPVLLAPPDGLAPDLLRPAFDWGNVPAATSYRIQISRTADFSILAVNTTVTPSSFTPGGDLPRNMLLHWRVRANGAKPGLWSPVRTFTSPNPPTAPSLVSPANSGLVTDYTPLLGWANAALAASAPAFDHYQVQLDEDSSFGSPLIEADTAAGAITASSYTLASDLTENTRFYWRVRSFNVNGEYSSWSGVRSFRTAILPPVLAAPDTGATPSVLRPAFDWDNVTGAGSYTIVVSRVADFSSAIVLNSTVPGATNSTLTPGVDLPAGATLYWRARANPAAGSFGPSGWSQVRNFTTPRPPSVPTLTAPANNALVTAYEPRLDWANSAMPLNAPAAFDHYQVQVATANTFASTFIDENVTISEFTGYTTPLTPNTRYFWRVRAWDAAGNSSSWSAVWSIRAAILPPAANSPTGSLDHLRPAFDWEDVAGAGGYTLQVSPVSSFATIVLNVSTVGAGSSGFTPTTDLPAGASLYWRVRANPGPGSFGPGAWSSPVLSLLTPKPPSIPALIAPANAGLVSGPSPLFDWADSTLPADVAFGHYQFQIASDGGFTSIVHDIDLPGITSSQDGTAVLTTGATYFWRVRAFSDLLHYSAWSSVRSVKINLAAPPLGLQTFAAGFSSPVHVTHAGDGSNRIFVVEKCGTVRIIESGTPLAADFLDISGRVNCNGERGLLSMAFPPDYASKQYFYVFYTDNNPEGTLTVSRFSVPVATPNQADPNSEEVILTIAHPASNHNGGQLAFGDDGYLYISTGDGGGAGDPNNNGQNANSLLGKILRIDVEGGTAPYGIPPGNPFIGISGKKAEIWALGLRNPWRISFDRLTHDLYIADVGQSAWEEVDFQPAGSPGGKNYGWRLREGNHCYSPSTGCGTPINYAAPVAEYSHTLGCSITGGFVYRGSAYPGLDGFYVYGDYCSGVIWALKQWNGSWYNLVVLDTSRSPSTFGEDEQGNLYLGDISNGTIYLVVSN